MIDIRKTSYQDFMDIDIHDAHAGILYWGKIQYAKYLLMSSTNFSFVRNGKVFAIVSLTKENEGTILSVIFSKNSKWGIRYLFRFYMRAKELYKGELFTVFTNNIPLVNMFGFDVNARITFRDIKLWGASRRM